VSLDAVEVADEPDAGDEACWLGQWRQGVLDLAWKALQQQEQERPGNLAYTLLRLRTEFPDDSSDDLARRLSQSTGQPIRADAVRQKLRRARVKFVDLLIAEVARGLEDPTPERVEEELVDLGLMEFLRELLPADWKPDES
jgi:RNA polymerase sigma-70 factor (ECF subfamily)